MDLWNTEKPVSDFGIDVPDWIDQDISPSDVAAICQGGCASGAYMPAVTYHQAAQTMAEHGDDVLDYIDNSMGELPTIPADSSWSSIAVFFLSCAVELWASSVESELEAMDDEDEAA
jgi:hypothetical protein